MTWAVEAATGSAAEFHGRDVPAPPRRAVWVHDVDAPALVLGSTQDRSVADPVSCDAAGVAVVRRRSGGGAVLLEPGRVLWVDVIVPRQDPLWDDDVARASSWLGRCWAAALAEAGMPGGAVHEGPMQRTPWSELVCFGGLGPGEVLLDGRKAVGVSQRRTRAAARFQCAVLADWQPDALLDLLALDPATRRAASRDLAGAARGIGEERLAPLLGAFLRRLP